MNFIDKNIVETHSFNFAAAPSPSLFRSHIWVQLFSWRCVGGWEQWEKMRCFLHTCIGYSHRPSGREVLLILNYSLSCLWTPVNIATQPGHGVSSARAELSPLHTHRSEPAFQLWQPYLLWVCALGSSRTELKHSHRKVARRCSLNSFEGYFYYNLPFLLNL